MMDQSPDSSDSACLRLIVALTLPLGPLVLRSMNPFGLDESAVESGFLVLGKSHGLMLNSRFRHCEVCESILSLTWLCMFQF